jgi:2-polyprenyl-3-methyl-5-hydroxy-6-metoxy-1,4-benzoquinol methylase
MRRINRPELMDEAQDPRELAGDLRNLERINRFLGGRSLIRRQLGRVLRGWVPASPRPWGAGAGTHAERGSRCRGSAPIVLDVAAGGGDLPRDAAARLRHRGLAASIVALDRNPLMLAYTRTHPAAAPEMRFVCGDALHLPFRSQSADVTLCSLALHHFTEQDAVALLRELARVTRRALIVNDLRRSPTAYALIWLITRFCRNRMTRYDGPLSVRRAFTMDEVRALAQAAGLQGARVLRQPFFRQALVWERRGTGCENPMPG